MSILKKRNEGMALMSVMILAIFVAGLVAVMSSRALWDTQQTQPYIETIKATEAANAGLELGTDQIFGGFTGGTMSEFTQYLIDSTGLQEGQHVELLNSPTLLRDLNGQTGAQIDSIVVTRALNGQDFVIESTGTSGGTSVTAMSGGRLGGEPFAGFGYALLARNINCIMCHATFDNIDRVNNTDPGEYGNFDRIKVASLESLLVRVGSSDSTIAGSYYTRGEITDKAGAPLSDLSGSGVSGHEFDPNTGKLLQDLLGDLVDHELELAGTDSDTGFYNPNEYLYTDYPDTEEGMTDGELPVDFPPVVPDSNGNKIVDGTEFADLVASKGSGTIEGGTVYGVSGGANYGDATLPGSSNGAATIMKDTGQYDGNLILTGTDADPILIDGPVFIDGDVVIKGPIEGKGQIFASGNMYFLGDTTYNDSSGDYGLNDESSGVGADNLVAYAAGGNILIGDYLSPKKATMQVYNEKKKKWETKSTDYDVMSPEAITVDTIDPGGPVNSGDPASFTMSEVTLFNKMEYEKHEADSTYVPRYYQLRDGDPIYRWGGDKEHGDKYDSDFVEITAAELSASNAGLVGLAPETASNGEPWMSELFLKKAWQDDELSRDAGGQPFQIDGLIYTSNSVMALARSNGKHNSRTYGQLKVRGGLVAADVGILSSGDKNLTSAQEDLFGLSAAGQGRGFVLLYDERVNGFLAIEDLGNLKYTRRVQVILHL